MKLKQLEKMIEQLLKMTIEHQNQMTQMILNAEETVYIKSIPDNSFSEPFYYKVIRKKDKSAVSITNTKNDVSIENSEDFYDHVGFITKTLCSYKYEFIEREEYDAQYILLINLLNSINQF